MNCPRILRDIADLIDALKDASGIVAFDGRPGVGKTHLANQVARELDLYCVHLDDYLDRGNDLFLDFLRYDEIKGVIRRPVIIEGICVLAVLRRISVHADVLVYVDSFCQRSRVQPSKAAALYKEVTQYEADFAPLSYARIKYYNHNESQSIRKESIMQARSENVDIAYINAKTRLAIVLAAGGFFTLLVGLVVLVLGPQTSSDALIKLPGLEISAKGLGGIIMTSSVAWGYLAYCSRPGYRHRHETVETGSENGAYERREMMFSTEASVIDKNR